jgi:hypothetical protein
VPQWTFAIYFFVILYAILFFSLCTLLFPSDLRDYSGYEAYFLSRRHWFFGLLAATFIADIIDSSLKGSAYRDRISHPNRRLPRYLLCRNVHQKPPHSTRPAGRLSPLPNRVYRAPL